MSRVDEIRKRLDDFRLHEEHGQVTFPAAVAIQGFHAAAPEDISYLLAGVEKLEGLLTRLVKARGLYSRLDFATFAANLADEARTLLADESKENEHAGI